MEDLFKAPAFIINLDRKTERYESALEHIKAAGYRDIRRFSAIDGSDPEAIAAAWRELGYATTPEYDAADPEFEKYPGRIGVYLSQNLIWKKMVDEKIPIATIFEDDVVFHDDWKILAPVYYDRTPADAEVIMMGAQFMGSIPRQHIVSLPTYCLHAYIVKNAGATKLLKVMRMFKPRTIDCILFDLQAVCLTQGRRCPFTYYDWCGALFPCKTARASNPAWNIRNHGLVFQDEKFESDIKPYDVDLERDVWARALVM